MQPEVNSRYPSGPRGCFAGKALVGDGNRKEKGLEEGIVGKYIRQLCQNAGETTDFADNFQEKLEKDREIYDEFVSYLKTGNFACQAKVEGYSVVDVMVWQMDHFKARLDRDNSKTRGNRDGMLLYAFHTLLNMREDPQKYIRQMQGETGTDYPGKY
ncbi:hypothetical protein IMSAGC019_01212 [Lachnospiraceae bacterium]|nr:hypothetical protein IMSAGC019_01212 [Lachnospiraceae bacterium]